MAEVIGLISGLAGICEAAHCLHKTLSRLATGIKNARDDILLVCGEINSTANVIDLVKDSLENSKHTKSEIVRKGRNIVLGVTAQCDFMFAKIIGLTAFVEPYYNPDITEDRPGQIVKCGEGTANSPRFLDKSTRIPKWSSLLSAHH